MTVDIRPFDPELLEPAFELATRVFFEGSTLHRALKVGLAEYRSYLRPDFEAMVAEGLSVAALDGDDKKVCGCLIVTDVASQLGAERATMPVLAPMAALNGELFDQYLQDHELRVGETALVDMGAVSPKTRGAGVYQKMRAAAHDLARKRGFQTMLGELSSTATQHYVLNRLGHKKVAEVAFDDFEFEGTRPFRSIVDPPSLILAEGVL